MPLYKNKQDQHNKWWRYEVQGSTVSVSWGRIGALKFETQEKSFRSPHERDRFIDGKIREKEAKGYLLTTDEDLKKEEKTARALGIENKIKRLDWVDMKGKTLTRLGGYDPEKYIYVEVLNSWSKKVTRLLLSRTESWELGDSIVEFDRKLTFSQRTPVHHSQFADAVRQMLRDLAGTVTKALKTVQAAALGVRNLLDDDSTPIATPAFELPEFESADVDRQVVMQFAALGVRNLEI